MHIIREKTDCNQKMKCGYLVAPKVGRTFFFYCSPRLIPIRESVTHTHKVPSVGKICVEVRNSNFRCLFMQRRMGGPPSRNGAKIVTIMHNSTYIYTF